MVLEATLLCVDNSEWMRNGDYTPSRIQAQADAVNLLCAAKLQSHPESTVGLMTYGGKSPEVLVTLTNDPGRILTAMHTVKLEGKPKISSGMMIAQLALKHRSNKNQRQRVIVFVGSPVTEDEASLVRLAKKLKKNNIAVDIINFGEEAENTAKLEAFIGAVNSSDNSHIVTVPPGPHVLSDILISSPIVQEEGAEGMGGGAGAGAGFEFGVDPNLDPELALALRISMEEERQRQERAAATAAAASSGGDAAVTPAPAQPAPASMDDDSEEAQLERALAMSMEGAAATPATPSPAVVSSVANVAPMEVDFMTEEEQLERALAMSMEQSESTSNAGSSSAPNPAVPSDLSSVLSSLPGVDPNDPAIQAMMKSMQGDKKEDDSKKK